MKKERIRKAIREGYGKVARGDGSCCGPAVSCSGGAELATSVSRHIGYSEKELKVVPEGANLGLGCGNPVALAGLKKGETVLDLGSGAGFDCFLAADRVGPKGRVIGVDMTAEMVEKARVNARKGKYRNVEFRLGEIENLPVADNSADIVISNCVINLSPDKERVFREAFRVLKFGGRLLVSDIVLTSKLPPLITKSVEAYVGCLAGATMRDKYLRAIEAAGFRDVKVLEATNFPLDLMANDPTAQAIIKKVKVPRSMLEKLARAVVSVKVRAFRPKTEDSRPKTGHWTGDRRRK